MTDGSPATGNQPPISLDTGLPHSARIWNYWLGGKDNFAADRAVGDHMLSRMPDMVDSARADRAFLGRAVRYLAGEAGIRQFLDIGTGLPTADNTHEVAQAVAPECRIVYVDNDPIVLAQDQASHQHLLAFGPTPGSAPALHTPHGSDAGRRPPHRQALVGYAVPEPALK